MTDIISKTDPNTGQKQVWRHNRWVTVENAQTTALKAVANEGLLKPEKSQLQPRSTEKLTGDHVSRAKAFQIRTRDLSFAFAVASMLIWFIARWILPRLRGDDVVSFGVSLIVAVLVGVSIFVGVWLFAYMLDLMTSPGGIGFIEAWRTQRRLDRQSNAMIDAFKKANNL